MLATSVSAATKPPPPLTLTPLLPTLTTKFSAGDELQQLLATPTSVFLIGTVETTSSALVSAAPLGGSDGFISALDIHGSHVWDLRLGTVGDDVATAGYIDAQGNIWIAGTSAIAPKATNQATELRQLTLWEISSAGVLVNTYSKSLPRCSNSNFCDFKRYQLINSR